MKKEETYFLKEPTCGSPSTDHMPSPACMSPQVIQEQNDSNSDVYGDLVGLLEEPCSDNTLPLKEVIVRDFIGRDIIAWEEGLLMLPSREEAPSYFRLHNSTACYTRILETIFNDPCISQFFTLALPNTEEDVFYIVNGDGDVAGVIRVVPAVGYLLIWRGSPMIQGLQPELFFKDAILRYGKSLERTIKYNKRKKRKDIDITVY